MNTNDILQSTIPQFDRSKDAFQVAEERRRWWVFLDPFLTPIVEKRMIANKPDFKNHPMLTMLATGNAQTLRASASTNELGATVSTDKIADLKNRYPNEYNLVLQAVRLSNLGKSQKEILETLQAEAGIGTFKEQLGEV